MQTLRTSCGRKSENFSESVRYIVDTYEDYQWSKFQLHSIIFMEVMAQKPPKLGPIGSGTLKNEVYQTSKVENGEYPGVKLCGFINYGKMRML